jgi:hypothetical protein
MEGEGTPVSQPPEPLEDGAAESSTSAGAPAEALPAAGPTGDSEARPAHADDKFYQGIIGQVTWSKGIGTVLGRNGREIPFDFSLVTMVGERRRIEHLLPGMRVGYDVGWTPHGLRITVLKLYD